MNEEECVNASTPLPATEHGTTPHLPTQPARTGGETGDEAWQTKSINFFEHSGDVVDDDSSNDNDDNGDGDGRSKLKIVNFKIFCFQNFIFSIVSLEFPDWAPRQLF